ncbi:MAG: GTPase HflX, partial [Gemmatimonadaceae bacterium]
SEVREADLLLHVIDASHPNWEEQREVVDQVLAELGAKEKPVLYVFSKIDAVGEAELLALRERIGNLLPGRSVFVSALANDGLEPLKRALLTAVRQGTQIAEIRIPAQDGKLLAEIYRTGSVLSQRTDDGEIVLRARVDEQLAARITRSGATVAYTR